MKTCPLCSAPVRDDLCVNPACDGHFELAKMQAQADWMMERGFKLEGWKKKREVGRE